MKRNIVIFCIFLLLSFFSWTQEISPATYVLIETHTNISGESDGIFYIDFPTYSIIAGEGILRSYEEIDVTDATKVIMGRGMSLKGKNMMGISTYLSLYDTLVKDGRFEIQPDGSAMIYYADQWISLLPGETWTETIETTEYGSLTGTFVVKHTVTNYGIWYKSRISQPEPTPIRTPISTPGPTGICGDVNRSGDVSIIDALLITQYYVRIIHSLPEPDSADVDSNEEINIVDALLIAQYSVGLPVTLVCP